MRYLFLLSFLVIIIGCEVKPQPIAYGQDGCSFCKMTIVDNQHSAEIVTSKGKAFKYDAIECMMNHQKDWSGPDVQLFLVADYSTPGKLVDATTASYLISQDIPSPMGAYLTAFEKSDQRDAITQSASDKKLDWVELQNQFE